MSLLCSFTCPEQFVGMPKHVGICSLSFAWSRKKPADSLRVHSLASTLRVSGGEDRN